MAIKLSPEQQKAIEEQKTNCPFCKIVKGDIPAKKVYEDAEVQAVMDINPASKGHMLVMPKEHYPIMSLIPDKTFEHLFSVTQQLCGVVQQGLLTAGSTVFIANGAAAGQQSQHFLLHVIPRENHDHLSMLEIPSKPVDLKEIDKIHTDLRNNLTIMLRNHFKQMGKQFTGEQTLLETMSPEKLIAIIEANQPILELLLTKPEEFKQLVPKHPQLSVMFKGKDVDAIVNEIVKKHGAKKKEHKEEKTEEKKAVPVEKSKPHAEEEEAKKKAPEKQEKRNEQEKNEEKKPSIDDIARLFTGK
ncbi:HIT domain-containing protein [Candidatus Woesearchaeota archaeon]|nr:HIT domain-containing protein [Candidatus Woesearchaeota archaeon]